MSFPTDLKHFRAHEFSHPDKMDPRFLIILDRIRRRAGVPIIVTDSFRPDDKGSAHAQGQAVDISDNRDGKSISSRWRFLVLRAAFAEGIRRIGVYDRHIHLDVSEFHPQDVCWHDVSK